MTVDNLAATLLLLFCDRKSYKKMAQMNKIISVLEDILISATTGKKYHRRWIRNLSCRGA